MKRTILIIVLLIGFSKAKSQSLTREFIDNRVNTTFTNVEIFSNSLYIIYGIPFEPDSVDIE